MFIYFFGGFGIYFVFALSIGEKGLVFKGVDEFGFVVYCFSLWEFFLQVV